MSQTYGRSGPAHPRLGSLIGRVTHSLTSLVFAGRHINDAQSAVARAASARFSEQLARGGPVYLLGITPAGHNAGVSLVEASAADGVNLICNEEEERYSGVKHDDRYPEHAVNAVLDQLQRRGLRSTDLHACLCGWDYAALFAHGMRIVMEHFPRSLELLSLAASPKLNHRHVAAALSAPARLGRQLGLDGPLPLIASRHHDNHAWFSFAVSPFAKSAEPVLVTVIDGYGDDGSISVYLGRDGRLTQLFTNRSFADSLGIFYSIISSTQGGWNTLSSEGRYMGAAAWGDGSRLTNPYYGPLREILHLGARGTVTINRAMINWHTGGERTPYNAALRRVLGDPIPAERLWKPDAVLNVDDVQHSAITRDRVDKAAATQLVFEDALFHIVGHYVRETGASRLVLTGGTALNGVAQMRMLEHFDEAYFDRHLGVPGRLKIWVPPTPGDAGVAMGAAFRFALASGARPGEPLRHAFYCGRAPFADEIRAALDEASDIGALSLGTVADPGGLARIADFMAFVVARGGVLGLFQGPAETGPRALGHRSIIANPCNPETLGLINARVKHRERIRPLAPMATLDAARRFFELSPGAGDDEHGAYNYMVLTARARPEAYARIPAVVHRDGTGRVQIVRPNVDALTHAYLTAMGRRVGVEVSVNTSLNVGSPIVQTPRQAVEVLRRSRGLTGLLLVADDGTAWVAWHASEVPPKDGGRELLAAHTAHQAETTRAVGP